MAQTQNHTLLWKRKHKKSENISEGTAWIIRTICISLGVLSAFVITVLLTFHIEIALLYRNFVYGEPIILKKPVFISQNIPLVHNDRLSNAPLRIDGTNAQKDSDSGQNTTVKEGVTQVGSYTYQVRIGSDQRMATAREVFDSLNTYRMEKGKKKLIWNGGLAEYAAARAHFFTENQILDEHEGFRKFVNEQNGFAALGFNSLGENSAYLSGGALMGKTIIEQLFASDIYHDNNQLDSKWTHVGIGIDNLAINIIFGGKKLD